MPQYDTGPLAEWISNDRRISRRESREVRRCVLDAMACLAAGWNTKASRDAARALKKGQQGMIARAMRYGAAMRALEFDDTELFGSTQPSTVILAALLPLAEQMDASMDELVRAYTAGFETIAWFGRCFGFVHHEADGHATAITGLFGAVAACASLLGHSAGQIQNGLSLATSYVDGLQGQSSKGDRSMHVGMAAANALMVVPLVSAGYRPKADVWSGPGGFMAAHHAAQSGSDFANAALGPQSALAAEGVVRRAWPSSHYTHRLIEAALQISTGINADDILGIELKIPLEYAGVVAITDPKNELEARFSAVYCVSTALTDGGVDLASFSERAIKRQSVSALMARIVISPYAVQGLGDMSSNAPDLIRIALGDGSVIEKEISEFPGCGDKPLNDRALVAKALHCLSAIADEAEAKQLVRLALQDASQVRELTAALTRKRGTA